MSICPRRIRVLVRFSRPGASPWRSSGSLAVPGGGSGGDAGGRAGAGIGLGGRAGGFVFFPATSGAWISGPVSGAGTSSASPPPGKGSTSSIT
ncbi:MAG TPA: hypothetical protein EYM71_06140, partial [Rhodospirillales bacterium]|nr:hypothetical protein [Rhodospirillales bacterium]